jgi:ParB/RepB/Spo0J family partition protein
MREEEIAKLKPHPQQVEIYGDEAADSELVRSIRENGVLQPVIITPELVILSGSRRCRAAAKAGLKAVPVEVREGLSETEQLAVLIEGNRQRVKTPRQMGREAIALQQVEAERAKVRQKAALKKGAARPVGEIFRTRETEDKGRASDKIGRYLGLSGRTVKKLIEIEQKIESLEASGQVEEAKKLETTLCRKSINAAHSQIRPKPAKSKPRPPRPIPDIPKGRQVAPNVLRARMREIGGCALTSTSNLSDRAADNLIWKHIKTDGDRAVMQAIALLVVVWPEEGPSFFIATVKQIKQGSRAKAKAGNGNGTDWRARARAGLLELLSECGAKKQLLIERLQSGLSKMTVDEFNAAIWSDTLALSDEQLQRFAGLR